MGQWLWLAFMMVWLTSGAAIFMWVSVWCFGQVARPALLAWGLDGGRFGPNGALWRKVYSGAAVRALVLRLWELPSAGFLISHDGEPGREAMQTNGSAITYLCCGILFLIGSYIAYRILPGPAWLIWLTTISGTGFVVAGLVNGWQELRQRRRADISLP